MLSTRLSDVDRMRICSFMTAAENTMVGWLQQVFQSYFPNQLATSWIPIDNQPTNQPCVNSPRWLLDAFHFAGLVMPLWNLLGPTLASCCIPSCGTGGVDKALAFASFRRVFRSYALPEPCEKLTHLPPCTPMNDHTHIGKVISLSHPSSANQDQFLLRGECL